MDHSLHKLPRENESFDMSSSTIATDLSSSSQTMDQSMSGSLDLNQHTVQSGSRYRGMDSQEFDLCESFAMGESFSGDNYNETPRIVENGLETVPDDEEDDEDEQQETSESEMTATSSRATTLRNATQTAAASTTVSQEG